MSNQTNARASSRKKLTKKVISCISVVTNGNFNIIKFNIGRFASKSVSFILAALYVHVIGSL